MFSPTITHESREVPGVRFTVHRMGYGRRVELDRKALALRQRLRELQMDYPELSPREKELGEQLEVARKKALAVDAAEVDKVIKEDIEPLAAELRKTAPIEVRKTRAAIEEEHSIILSEIRCVWIREGLISIKGGDLDGMTADQLLSGGPPALTMEIYAALSADGLLTGEAAKNSQSPGTGGAAEPAATTTTTAANAEKPDGTSSATASDTSQAA